MRLQQWAANGWLRPHQTTRSQIADLLAIVERDIEDSDRDLSVDWQFGIAYNATLKLCTITQSEATELRNFTRELRAHVLEWLRTQHPALLVF